MHDLSRRRDPDVASGHDDPVARHVSVSGRVQGVWFRRSLQQEADTAGVAGWGRNRDDGTVEVWLEGPIGDVEQVLAWIRAGGPPAAQVERVAVDDRVPAEYAAFELR